MNESVYEEIERSVERVFATNVDGALREDAQRGRWPQASWELVARSGFASALASAAHGGVGATWTEAWPILRGIGYWQVPLPLAETMVARLLLSLALTAPVDAISPDEPIALVDRFEPSDASGAIVREPGTDRARVRGRAPRVAWARHCRWALMAAATQASRAPAAMQVASAPAATQPASAPAATQPASASAARRGAPAGALLLLDLRSSRVRMLPGANLAGEPSDDLEFDGAPARCLANPLPALGDPVLQLGALARSAMIAGALESALAQSVRHANERVQFGRPIGRYQAIQHALAVLAGEAAAARMASVVAAAAAPSSAVPHSPTAAFDIAVAKLRCSEAATRGAPIAHQVHGAIGYTREHPLHAATGRLGAWRAEFGTDAEWADRLGVAAIAAGSDAFWPSLTRRGFEAALS